MSWWPDLNPTGPCFLFIEDKNWTDLWSKIYCWRCTETKLWENVLMSKYLRIYLWTRELKHWILFRATKTFHDKAVGLWNCGPSKKKHWRLKCYWTEQSMLQVVLTESGNTSTRFLIPNLTTWLFRGKEKKTLLVLTCPVLTHTYTRTHKHTDAHTPLRF